MLDRVTMYICPWQPRDVKTSILKTCIFRGGSNANEFYRSTGLDKIILRGTLNISSGEACYACEKNSHVFLERVFRGESRKEEKRKEKTRERQEERRDEKRREDL